jgi:hypothetical protein
MLIAWQIGRLEAGHPEASKLDALAALKRIETVLSTVSRDLDTLLPIGRMYLDALDADPEYEMLTLPEAIGVTRVREVVKRGEAR